MRKVVIALGLMLAFMNAQAQGTTDLGFSYCKANGPFPNCDTPTKAITYAQPKMEATAGCTPGDEKPCLLTEGNWYDFHLLFKYVRNPGAYPGTVRCKAFFVPTNDLHFPIWSECELIGGLCQIEFHITGLE